MQWKTAATAEKVAAHFRSQQVSTVAIQIETFSNKLSEMTSMNILKPVHPIVKGLFTEDLPITPLAVRLSHYSKEWKIFNIGSGDFVNCKRVQISLSLDSIPDQNPSPSAFNKNTSTCNRKRNAGFVKERPIRMVEDTLGEFLSNM